MLFYGIALFVWIFLQFFYNFTFQLKPQCSGKNDEHYLLIKTCTIMKELSFKQMETAQGGKFWGTGNCEPIDVHISKF